MLAFVDLVRYASPEGNTTPHRIQRGQRRGPAADHDRARAAHIDDATATAGHPTQSARRAAETPPTALRASGS